MAEKSPEKAEAATEAIWCFCRVPCQNRIVEKESKNFGRKFVSCANGKCKVNSPFDASTGYLKASRYGSFVKNHISQKFPIPSLIWSKIFQREYFSSICTKLPRRTFRSLTVNYICPKLSPNLMPKTYAQNFSFFDGMTPKKINAKVRFYRKQISTVLFSFNFKTWSWEKHEKKPKKFKRKLSFS